MLIIKLLITIAISLTLASPAVAQEDIFGEVKNPINFDGQGYGGVEDQTKGPLTLLSNFFQLVAAAAGIYSLINVILAGFQYVTSQGDPKQTEEAWKKIYMSLIGLSIIACAFILAAIVGQIFFGKANFIFTPKIYGPGN